MVNHAVTLCLASIVTVAGVRVSSAAPTTAASSLTPTQTVEALVKATHNSDPEAYRAVISAEGELEQQVLDTASDLIAASAVFRQASVTAYGEAETAKYNLRIDKVTLPLEALPGLANAEEKIDRDTARVSDPGSSKSLELRQINGQWKIPLSELIPQLKTKPELMRQNMKALKGFASVLRETAGDVEKKHLRTAEEAAVILKLRLTRSHEKSGASDAPKSSTKEP